MANSDLTIDKLLQMQREIEKLAPRRNDYNPFTLTDKPNFGGMNVFVEPAVQKVYVRQIYFPDGTPILSEEFLKQENDYYAARFGYREPLCKDHAIILGSWGLLVSRPQYAMLMSMGA